MRIGHFCRTLFYRGSYKVTVVCLSIHCSFGPSITLLVHPSVFLSLCPSICQCGIFLWNGSLVFFNFLHDGRSLESLKTDRALFSWKIYFCPKFGQKWPKMAPQNSFLDFLKNVLTISFLEII